MSSEHASNAFAVEKYYGDGVLTTYRSNNFKNLPLLTLEKCLQVQGLPSFEQGFCPSDIGIISKTSQSRVNSFCSCMLMLSKHHSRPMYM